MPSPTGTLSVAIDSLKTLIANVPYFQTWVGVGSAAAALASIFTGELGIGIFSITITGGVVTVVTKSPHLFTPAQVIEIQGASLGLESAVSIDGTQTVVSTPTTTSFTFATSLANQTILYPEGCLCVPAARPIACISESDDSVNYNSIADAVPIVNGSLEVLLEANISTANKNDPANALLEMKNAFGQFCDGLMVTAGTADFMFLKGLKTEVSPKFIDRTEQNDSSIRFERWQALIRVTWGVD